jgi:hypothetical protein
VSGVEEGSAYADYLEGDIRVATRLCALPHWLDDDLGVELLEVVGFNGTSARLIAQVKRLPLVQPYEGGSWRVEEVARGFFIREMAQTDQYRHACLFLGRRFADHHDAAKDPSERDARLAQWRAAYHLADVDAANAACRLTELVTEAGARHRIADMEAAAELFDGKTTLAAFKVEAAYARGRLAYSKRAYKKARKELQTVWDAGSIAKKTSISGHLIASIDTREKKASAETERIFRRAAQIAKDVGDDFGRHLILTSLVNHLLARKGMRVTDEMEMLAKECVEICEELSNHYKAATYNTLGQVQVQRGPTHHSVARVTLDRAIKFAEDSRDLEQLGMALLSRSWLARSEGDLVMAASLVAQKLLIDIALDADKNVVLTTKRLADLLTSADTAPPGWLIVDQSSQCLAYFDGSRLVIARRSQDTKYSLSVPAQLLGQWKDTQGRRLRLDATMSLWATLGGRVGVVLARIDGR